MFSVLFYFMSAQAASANCSALNSINFEIPGVQLQARTVKRDEYRSLMELIFGKVAFNFDSKEVNSPDDTAKLVWTNHFEPLLQSSRFTYHEMAKINMDSKITIFDARSKSDPKVSYFDNPAQFFKGSPFAIITVGIFSGAKLIGFASIYKDTTTTARYLNPHFSNQTVFITVALSRQTRRLVEVTKAAMNYAFQTLKVEEVIVPLPIDENIERLGHALQLNKGEQHGNLNYMWRNTIPVSHSAAGND